MYGFFVADQAKGGKLTGAMGETKAGQQRRGGKAAAPENLARKYFLSNACRKFMHAGNNALKHSSRVKTRTTP